MNVYDCLRLAFGAVIAHRLRSVLSLVGIAIGVGAVILLTSIGEGTRQYVLSQFTQFGTNILAINPGKTKTLGMPGVLGGTTHKLTLEDAEMLKRIPGVEAVVPMAMGMGRVEAKGLGRSINVFGVTSAMPEVWKFSVAQGSFLPEVETNRTVAVAVLGPKVKRELFGDANPLGQFVRIAGYRLRVVGVMEPKGQILGFDLDDSVYVAVANAMKIFNLDEVVEIDVTYTSSQMLDGVVDNIRHILTERHRGTEDFTITTQAAMVEVLDKVMNVVTLAAGGIAGISLIVGAIGILTMLGITVGERTSEIGLLRAIGATSPQIFSLFLVEAIALAAVGGCLGIVLGLGLLGGIQTMVPKLPVYVDLTYIMAALVVGTATGLFSGLVPARRASLIDPVEALHSE